MVVSLLSTFRAWIANTPDTAWKPTGIVQKFAGFDESKAVVAAARAADLDMKRRDLAQQRAGQATPAGIADISERRRGR